MPPLNELLSAAPFANFLKEMQTRFFFICAGAFVFWVLNIQKLNFNNQEILNNSTVVSGLFVINLLAFAFPIYFFAVCVDFYVECRKDNYLTSKALLRKATRKLNNFEARLTVEALNKYTIFSGGRFNFLLAQEDFNKAQSLMNYGLIKQNGSNGTSGTKRVQGFEFDNQFLRYLFDNDKLVNIVKNKATESGSI